jgi:hypothetical protein
VPTAVAHDARSIDALVENVYREAGENSAAPLGIGPLLKDFFRPICHTVWNQDVHTTRGWAEKHPGGDWLVHLPGHPTSGAVLGYAIARVLAHEAIERWSIDAWSDRQECVLADAIVLPTPALVLMLLGDRPVSEIAAFLVTSPELVERRCRVGAPEAPSSRMRMRIAPLAKVAEVIDLDIRRQRKA